MTVLVAVRDSDTGSVVMAADGQTTTGWYTQTTDSVKIWRVDSPSGEWLLGGTGAVRDIQLAHFAFAPPRTPTDDLVRYLSTEYAAALRSSLRDNGALHVKDNQESWEASLLIAHRGSIMKMYSDFAVVSPTAHFMAAGSGCSFALGALHATPPDLDVEQAARLGVEAACRFDIYCSGEPTIETLQPAEPVAG